MNTHTPKIDELAEAIWRRVIGYVSYEATTIHQTCLTKDPDGCDLFREIHDEVTMWDTKQTKQTKQTKEGTNA